MSKTFFYKVFYNNITFYDASHKMTPNNRWIRIQNNYLYREQTLPMLLKNIFDLAKKDGTIPKFEIVKEQVTKVEPKIKIKKEKPEPIIKEKRERIKLSPEQKRENRIKYEKENADKIKAKRREHYELNHERLLEEKKAYHQANRDIIIASKRQYRIDHADEISQKKKLYYQKKKLAKAIENKIEIDSGSLVIENNK